MAGSSLSRRAVLVGAAAGLAARARMAVAGLPEVIERIRPSVVAVGTFQAIRRPPARLIGTGFAVGQGGHILTNAHVVPEKLDDARNETLAIFAGRGFDVAPRRVSLVDRDDDFDIALLRVEGGERFAPVSLAGAQAMREGQSIAITGYPIAGILGLYPITHRGMVSAVAPYVLPQASGRTLDTTIIRRLRNNFYVFQLDATAFPGNSGSPVYDAETGVVIGIVNSVFVRGGRERALQDPSGITYAVPIEHVRNILRRNGIDPG